MTDTVKIEDQVRKLLAKASGTENEHEAAAFMAKAQELLARYNLDAAKVASGGVDPRLTARVEEKRVDVYLKPWMTWLHGALSRLYFCDIYNHQFIYEGKKQRFLVKGITYVGKPHNVEVAVSMADYLVKTVERLARAHSKDPRQQDSFKKGCASRLHARLEAMREEAAGKAQQAVTTNPDNLPALYASEASQVKSVMDGLGLRTRKASFKVSDGSSYRAGGKAGNDVSLDKQVRGAQAKQIAA